MIYIHMKIKKKRIKVWFNKYRFLLNGDINSEYKPLRGTRIKRRRQKTFNLVNLTKTLNLI